VTSPTDARLQGLSPQRRALVERLQAAHARQRAGIDRADRTRPIPLSFAQQRLWLIDQLTPGDALYVIPGGVRLKGPIDIVALERAWAEITRRHEVLRTRFGTVGDSPVQLIDPPGGSVLERLDLRDLAVYEQSRRLTDLAAMQSTATCDLHQGPLVRARLVMLGDEDHALLLTFHHIVGDAWSMDVLVREVGALYSAFTRGKPSPLPDLPVQYADYAIWQRRAFESVALASQVAYWRRQLRDLEPLTLPIDRVRSARVSAVAAQQPVHVPLDTANALRALTRVEGATPFMALAASLQITLARFANSSDVAIGTPVANRSSPETEGLIGFFVNTLVLRTRVDASSTGREFLRSVRDVCLAAYANQDVPFERLVEVLNPDRSVGRSPLFDVLFSFENVPVGELQLPGVVVEPIEPVASRTSYDLTLTLGQTGDGIRGALGYPVDLFDPDTVDSIARFWERATVELARDPDRPLSELWSRASADGARKLDAWQRGAQASAEDPPIHYVVAEEASRHPDRPAVLCGDDTVTYHELEQRANRLAHYLQECGAGPEVRVAVCLERGVDFIAAVLATLKAGSAYVALDPNHPAARSALVLADSGAKVLVSRRPLIAALMLRPPDDTHCVRLDEQADAIAQRPERPPPTPVGLDNVAYLVYTSGSTGTPKGVEVSHRALSSYMHASQRALPLGRDDRMPFKYSVAFDATAVEVFAPLIAGAAIVIAPQDTEFDAGALVRLFDASRVTVIDIGPAQLRQLLDAGLDRCKTIRLIDCGGERMTPDLCARVLACEGVELHNAYGPSETTIETTRYRCERGSVLDTVPIGRPIDNAETYVLDPSLSPLPVGAVGELYVGGPGLARGYLNRPALTAERFVPNLFSNLGARMYRTGDLCRWRRGGVLEYVGRADVQVKIRGVRIEPGEIEAALRRAPGIADAAVVGISDSSGAAQLAAYVVGAPETSLDLGDLRATLARELPAQMLPAHIVQLPELPRTATGKLDRRALPPPGSAAAPGGPHATTPTEELVAGIWAGALRQERVGAQDDFFALGGHSLLATQVVSQVRAVVGVDVPLRQLFDTPRLADFAAAVDRARRGGAPAAPPLRRAARDRPLPLSFAQQRLWFLDHLEPGSTVFNQVTAVRLRGPLDRHALERALATLVERHEVLRTRIVSEGGVAAQVIDPTWGGRLEYVDVRRLSAGAQRAEVRHHVEVEADTPFDLSRGPLIRARLLAAADDEHVLVVTMHHIVTDGWSMGVLIREMGVCYDAFTRGDVPELPSLPVQYADYAAWQRAWLVGEVLESQLAYWRRQLTDLPPLELPTDRPRPAVPSRAAATLPFDVPADLVARLRTLAREEGATVFMVLLAGFDLLLSRYTGQHDVAVGTDVANRTRAETAPLVGFFVNQLVLRTDLRGNPTVRELLGRVREACLGAYAHQDVPFERVVEELNPVRSLSRAPLFQVKLLLQNAPPAGRSPFSGLEISPFDGERVAAQHDLVINLVEVGDALHGECAYASELFDRTSIERLVRRWIRLLAAMTTAGSACET
jgi:amino acid adenylation domain-containing protein